MVPLCAQDNVPRHDSFKLIDGHGALLVQRILKSSKIQTKWSHQQPESQTPCTMRIDRSIRTFLCFDLLSMQYDSYLEPSDELSSFRYMARQVDTSRSGHDLKANAHILLI